MSSIDRLPQIASYAGGVLTHLGAQNLYQYFTTADLVQKGAALKSGALKLAIATASYAVSVGTTAQFVGTELIIRNLKILGAASLAVTALSIVHSLVTKLPSMNKEDRRAVYKQEFTKVAFGLPIFAALELTTHSKEVLIEKLRRTGEVGGCIIASASAFWAIKQSLSAVGKTDIREQNFLLKDALGSFLIAGGSLAMTLGLRALRN